MTARRPTYESLVEIHRASRRLDRQTGPPHPAILVTDGREITRTVSFGELSESSNRLANALAGAGRRGRATGSRSSSRSARRRRSPTSRPTSSARSRCRSARPSAPMRSRFDFVAPSHARSSRSGTRSSGRAALGFDGVADRRRPRPRRRSSRPPRPTSPPRRRRRTRRHCSSTPPARPAPPKGALHGHRVLAGHLPGFELSHDFFPQPGDRIWTPADWAWIGGLYDVVMPGLAHGVPVVAFRTPRFDPEQAFDVIAHAGIRNVFMPATALRLMRRAERRARVAAHARERRRDGRRGDGSVVRGAVRRAAERVLRADRGEPPDRQLRRLARAARAGWDAPTPGTSCGSSTARSPSASRATRSCSSATGATTQATAAKVRDGWLHTGDLAEVDDEGTYRSIGRVDDLISSGGHRIGPGEIEECLIRHPSVSVAAAIGVPDEVRGEVVKAFVVAVPGVDRLARSSPPSCSSTSARGSRPSRCRARSSSWPSCR